jgi:hypothetical protein
MSTTHLRHGSRAPLPTVSGPLLSGEIEFRSDAAYYFPRVLVTHAVERDLIFSRRLSNASLPLRQRGKDRMGARKCV